MGYALFRDVKGWVSQAAATSDSQELAQLVNDIRNLLYNAYETLPLFRDVTQCFDVQSYCEDCITCRGRYRGITLPRDMQTPEAMWFQRFPIIMNDAWRQWANGLSPECACGISSDDLGSAWPTERDLLPGKPLRIQVRCALNADIGKTIIVAGMSVIGQKFEQTFQLSTTYQATDLPMVSINKGGGVRKDVTTGPVIIADETGRALSIYAPDETVPGYRRLRLSGVPDHCGQVNVRAARAFHPLCADFDVVESDNQLGFTELARYFRLNNKVQKDGNDIAALKMHLAQGMAHFSGQKARDIGKGVRSQIAVASPHFAQHHQLRRGRTGRY